MLILRHAERAATRWKNGLGVTYEVARADDDDGMLWRVSIAVCETACPFSRFDGVDRALKVLAGDAMRLTIDGVPHEIGVGDPWIHFKGESSVDCEPLGAPTYDLNVMTRRGAVHAEILDSAITADTFAQFDAVSNGGVITLPAHNVSITFSTAVSAL